MKKLLYGSILMAALITACSSPTSQKYEAFIDSIMASNYQTDGPGAVVLVAKGGNPVYRKAFGLASIELGIKNKPEDLFNIGSMSKQFTAVCILKLAQEGKLSLTDDIRKYLPGFNTHNRAITIENLLSHTSGIPSYTEKQDFMPKMKIDHSREDIMNYFMEDSLQFEPGTDWSYSNSGYFLTGLIIEKVSGVSLNEYLQKNIFEPLDMKCSFIGTYENIIPNAVSGYSGAGNNKYKPAESLSWSWQYGAGGIITNVDDLLKWDNALYTDKVIKQEWLERAWENQVLENGQNTNYGYGWSIIDDNNFRIISHEGAIFGFLSCGIRIPSEKIYIAILSNTSAKSLIPFYPLIALKVANKSLNAYKPLPVSNEILKDYTGVYKVHRLDGRIVSNFGDEKIYRYISIMNDTLFSQLSGGSKKTLLNIGEDLFITKGTNIFKKFHRDDKGRVVSLEEYERPIPYGPDEIENKTDIPLPKDKVAVSFDLEKIVAIKGKYDFGGGFYLQIFIEGGKVYAQNTGENKEEIFAESETKFFFKSIDATLEFISDKEGKVTGVILKQRGKYPANKIE